ncbi:hypothetical protein B0T20DRAFT_476949 [Sordaria brevicollis]|uniref:Uncharacterized protein n=1 Tax=Sordaria brevicollis TaxID=83679 RepID=A0AAE0UE35_SORBR|nr:hypothetical protein B0T20DRAFT_476949 [Sordaria brevicollis]
MSSSIYRPQYPEYNPEIHELPEKGITLDQALAHRLARLNSWPTTGGRRRKQLLTADDLELDNPNLWGSKDPKKKIRISWVTDPKDSRDPRYKDEHTAKLAVAATEVICQEEADRLGLTCVVIRQMAHNTRNVYANGRTVTIYNERSGRFENAQKPADTHFTVWMGHTRNELLLQGHIYVVSDPSQFGSIKKMNDPINQRKHVSEEDGERAVSEEYWSLTKDPLKLKQ